MNLAPNIVEELTVSELCAKLHIIAKDALRLTADDRQTIVSAAAELEIAYRQLLLGNANLCMMAAQTKALQDRIAFLMPKLAQIQWAMKSGISARFG